MKTETKLKIIINILCLLLGMTSTALYLSVKQTKNREATIKIVNEARVSWRDEAYRRGYGQWLSNQPNDIGK